MKEEITSKKNKNLFKVKKKWRESDGQVTFTFF